MPARYVLVASPLHISNSSPPSPPGRGYPLPTFLHSPPPSFVFPPVFLFLTLSVWSCHSTAMILRLTGLIYPLPFTILLAHIHTRIESKVRAKRRWLLPIYFNLLFIRCMEEQETFSWLWTFIVPRFSFYFFFFFFNLEITIFLRDKEKAEEQCKQRRYFGRMKFNWDSLFFFFACKFFKLRWIAPIFLWDASL